MYAPEFDYHKAGSVAEAVQLLGSHQDAKLLAGGQSLIPLMKLRLARPAVLVDIGGIADLKGISVNGETIHIGGLTTHHEIASSTQLKNSNPMLVEVAAGIGDQAVRNRGTIGGNLAHADPGFGLGHGADRPERLHRHTGSRRVSFRRAGNLFPGSLHHGSGRKRGRYRG